MKVIERSFYLNRLTRVIGTRDIKVITGIRRSGKSELLSQFKVAIKQQISDANIISVDLSNLSSASLRESHALHEFISHMYQPRMHNFVIIDEIQLCDGFEELVTSLHAEKKYDIYITGSNAFLLNNDLATLFTGRTFAIEVFPFSFHEFLIYHDYDFSTDDHHGKVDLFEQYLEQGGMAGVYDYSVAADQRNYLTNVYNDLIFRDIVERYGVKNSTALRNLSNFLMDNISNISSSRSIAGSFAAAGENISNHTVDSYIEYLCNAFAFYEIGRYDVKGKRYLNLQSKYYLADHAFRAAILGTKITDYGRVLENIVAIELLRRGFEIYAGTMRAAEIDFVAIKGDKKIYIQVAERIDAEPTLERELRPLLKIPDAYPKIILARTDHPEAIHDGVIVRDVVDWLAQGSARPLAGPFPV